MAFYGLLKLVVLRFQVLMMLAFGIAGFHVLNGNAAETSPQPEDPLVYHIDQTKRELEPLNLAQAPALTASAEIYLTNYGIHFKDIKHYLGTFKSGSYRLSAHVLIPSNAKATIFVLHGYLDHIGTLKNLIRLCVQEQFAVAMYDLPGHGLSDGVSCSINDFSEYVSVFRDFIELCRPYLPQPYHFVGHSTGCAIAFDYMHRVSDKNFDKVVFIAPLVRSAYWTLSKANHYLAKPFIDSVPRVFFDNTSDPDFNAFIRNDPLQCTEIPLRWVEALFVWNEHVEAYKPISHPILILQGSEDTVVDWQFNIPFNKRKNDSVTVKWFEKGKHHLLNERQAIRLEVLNTVRSYLQTGQHSTIPIARPGGSRQVGAKPLS